MNSKVFAVAIALGSFAFVVAFIWTPLRAPGPEALLTNRDQPTASTSEVLSDGLLDVQVYVLGDLNVRLEMQFASNAGASDAAGMRPDLNFAMLAGHMDGFDPPLELLGPGKWRAALKLPMAGRWVVSAGFGEDRAEVEFDAE